MPSGTTVTATPSTVDARAVGHQPAQGSDAQPVARRAVRARVGEEPAGHADGHADHQRARPRRPPRRAGRPATSGRRCRRSRRSSRPGAAGSDPESSEVMSGHHRRRGRRIRAPRRIGTDRGRRATVEATSRSPRGSTSSTRTSARGCCCRPTASPATSAAERAVRDALVVAWHHWRKVSRRRGPGGLGPRAGLPARRTPAHGRCGTARRVSTPTPGPPSTRWASCRSPSAGCCW